MKVYRVIPDTFLVDSKVEEIPPKASEGIFYKMGYTSFCDNVLHTTNNIYKNLTQKIGKYFFIFFEDAVKIGYRFLNECHYHFLNTFLILEYDIPLDIILNHCGYGIYDARTALIETFIPKDDFGNNILSTKDISIEEKRQIIKIEFLNSMKNIIQFGYDYSSEDFDFYFYLLNITSLNDFKSFLQNEEDVEKFLKEYTFFFDTIERQLIKSNYITGRVIRINIDYLYNEIGTNNLDKYFETKGYIYNLSERQEKLKNTIIHSIKDKEKVKSLLLQKH